MSLCSISIRLFSIFDDKQFIRVNNVNSIYITCKLKRVKSGSMLTVSVVIDLFGRFP